MNVPLDAEARRNIAPVVCYPDHTLPRPDMALRAARRKDMTKIAEVTVPPREAW
jgi:uncharacterized protein YcgI (DUF1989 family)